jgi:hypothetical protein
MNYSTYLPLAKRTEGFYEKVLISAPGLVPYNQPRLVHMALGLATEAIELVSAVHDKKPLVEQLMELSDICWFSALACETVGFAPDDVNPYPGTGIYDLADRCELFASRVKAGIVYGSPAKASDSSPDAWRKLPAEIFLRACAIGNANVEGKDDILELNIAKLRARYPDKFTTEAALVRDEAAETKAVVSEGRMVVRSKQEPRLPANLAPNSLLARIAKESSRA